MEVRFCPYCGTKIESDEHICSNCGNEINFVDSGALDTDNFIELKILHEGVKFGRRTFIATIISTIICFFLPIFFLNTRIHNLGIYVFVQLIIYESIVVEFILVAYAFYNNRRCKKHGYNSIGYFKASLWIGLFGLAFGLTFVISILSKALIPGLNPSVPSSPNVNILMNYLKIKTLSC